MVEGLTEGRSVHYVHPDSGKHMAATVVHVWDNESGTCNLFVPPDGVTALSPFGVKGVITSVQHDPDATAGTWHYIEKA